MLVVCQVVGVGITSVRVHLMLLDRGERVGDARHSRHRLQSQVANVGLAHADEATQQTDGLRLQVVHAATEAKTREREGETMQGGTSETTIAVSDHNTRETRRERQ